MSPDQAKQKERAMKHAEHHAKHGEKHVLLPEEAYKHPGNDFYRLGERMNQDEYEESKKRKK